MSATGAIAQFTEEAIRDYKMMLHLMPVAYEFLALAFRNKIVQKALKQYFRHYMDVLVPIIQRGLTQVNFARWTPRKWPSRRAQSTKVPCCCGFTIAAW